MQLFNRGPGLPVLEPLPVITWAPLRPAARGSAAAARDAAAVHCHGLGPAGMRYNLSSLGDRLRRGIQIAVAELAAGPEAAGPEAAGREGSAAGGGADAAV